MKILYFLMIEKTARTSTIKRNLVAYIVIIILYGLLLVIE